MSQYKAFIFDMNGTMIDDMHYHEMAWYDVLVNQLRADLTPEQVRKELYGKADEMFTRIFGTNRFTKEEIDVITSTKESRYRQEFLPQLKLMEGLNSFLDKARAHNISLAIGTAAPDLNVDFVLDNLSLRSYFPIIIGQNDVSSSKPHPEVFLKAASALGVHPENCLVFEDAPKGIEAAHRAGMKAIGVTSFHTAEELRNDNIIHIINDYRDSMLNHLFNI